MVATSSSSTGFEASTTAAGQDISATALFPPLLRAPAASSGGASVAQLFTADDKLADDGYHTFVPGLLPPATASRRTSSGIENLNEYNTQRCPELGGREEEVDPETTMKPFLLVRPSHRLLHQQAGQQQQLTAFPPAFPSLDADPLLLPVVRPPSYPPLQSPITPTAGYVFPLTPAAPLTTANARELMDEDANLERMMFAWMESLITSCTEDESTRSDQGDALVDPLMLDGSHLSLMRRTRSREGKDLEIEQEDHDGGETGRGSRELKIKRRRAEGTSRVSKGLKRMRAQPVTRPENVATCQTTALVPVSDVPARVCSMNPSAEDGNDDEPQEPGANERKQGEQRAIVRRRPRRSREEQKMKLLEEQLYQLEARRRYLETQLQLSAFPSLRLAMEHQNETAYFAVLKESRLEVIRRLLAAVNEGALDNFDHFLVPNCVLVGTGFEIRGAAKIYRSWMDAKEHYRQMHWEDISVNAVDARGDHARVESILRGKFKGKAEVSRQDDSAQPDPFTLISGTVEGVTHKVIKPTVIKRTEPFVTTFQVPECTHYFFNGNGKRIRFIWRSQTFLHKVIQLK